MSEGSVIGLVLIWWLWFLVSAAVLYTRNYNVYTNELSGKAEFVKAEQNRKIKLKHLREENYSGRSKYE